MNKVDRSRKEYEEPTEEFLRALRKKILLNEITSEKYCSMVSKLTPKTVATWIQKNALAFKGKSIESIVNGVQYSDTWKNREQILNVETYQK